MMMVETLTPDQLNASDSYLNSTDPWFSKRFWIGVWFESGNYVWISSYVPLSVSKNSLDSSSGVDFTNILRAAFALIFFCQKNQSQTIIREKLRKAFMQEKGASKMLVNISSMSYIQLLHLQIPKA